MRAILTRVYAFRMDSEEEARRLHVRMDEEARRDWNISAERRARQKGTSVEQELETADFVGSSIMFVPDPEVSGIDSVGTTSA